MQAMKNKIKIEMCFWVDFIPFEYLKSRCGELFVEIGNPSGSVFTANHDVHETRLRAMVS